jgi:hypothetical protein
MTAPEDPIRPDAGRPDPRPDPDLRPDPEPADVVAADTAFAESAGAGAAIGGTLPPAEVFAVPGGAGGGAAVAVADPQAPVDEEPGEEPGEEPRRRTPEDWKWVVEARSSGEPTPWPYGLALTFFVAALVASAIFVLSSGLADVAFLAVVVNLVVAAGLAPAMWLARRLPILRWVAGGTALGIVIGWVASLVFLL